MSMTANHVRYLSAKTLPALTERVKLEWKLELKLEGNPDNPQDWAHMELETGEFITVGPCPFGYLAQYESQERLTGDAEDHDYVMRIDDENWERMQYALSELRR